MPMRMTGIAAFVALTVVLAVPVLQAQEDADAREVFIDEDFSEGMENWWVEGGERVWVEDGRLHVKADPPEGSDDPHVVTVWCHTPVRGNWRAEFDAHIIESRTNVPHINFMFLADPEGASLYDSREERADAAFDRYQVLNGNIITYHHADDGRQTPRDGQVATLRVRHCPGFVMLGETLNYHCQPGHTYRIEIIKRGNAIIYRVDGNQLLRVRTIEAWDEGLIALRTFRTYLWWDNIRVTALD